MVVNAQLSDPRNAYGGVAPHYDAFTAGHEYGRWTVELIALAERHGPWGRRLLDVGCGTGKSFLLLLGGGWAVTGCDLSPAVLAVARASAGPRVDLHVADVRRLPRFSAYDHVPALCDVINYMRDPEDLVPTFRTTWRLTAA